MKPEQDFLYQVPFVLLALAEVQMDSLLKASFRKLDVEAKTLLCPFVFG